MKRDLHNTDWKISRYDETDKVDERNELCKVVDDWLYEIDTPNFFDIEWGKYLTNSKHHRFPNEEIVSIKFKKKYMNTHNDIKRFVSENIMKVYDNWLYDEIGTQERIDNTPFKDITILENEIRFIGLKEVQ